MQKLGSEVNEHKKAPVSGQGFFILCYSYNLVKQVAQH